MDVKINFSDGILTKITLDQFKLTDETRTQNVRVLMLKGDPGDTGIELYDDPGTFIPAVIITQSQYEELVDSGQIDSNTLYLVYEEDA